MAAGSVPSQPPPSTTPYNWYWLLALGYLGIAGGYLYYYGRR